MAQPRVLRDHSGRLTYEFADIESEVYPQYCDLIAQRFSLVATDQLVPGLDFIAWEFHLGDIRIGLDWDIWSGFIVVAKDADAEPSSWPPSRTIAIACDTSQLRAQHDLRTDRFARCRRRTAH